MPSARLVLDHAGLVVSDFAASCAFYEAALSPLGFALLNQSEKRASFGLKGADDFGITEGFPVTHNAHIAFVAQNEDAVRAFYASALSAGGRDNGAPGLHLEYHPSYFAAFVFDPDGNNIEAVFHGR
jgi:catechol 2,3-dioxygenase-like lactoylglutathione lyase family enzyme